MAVGIGPCGHSNMRYLVGILLVGAAGLKVIGLHMDPSAALRYSNLWLPAHAQICMEAAVGGLALTGAYWRHVRWVATILFAAFAVYSLVLVSSGAPSCECFGPIRVSPWWTLWIDAAVVAGLVWSNWFARATEPSSPFGLGHADATRRERMVVVTVVGLSVGGTAAATWNVVPRALDDGSSLSAIGNLMVLEPKTWVGKALPISKFIDLDLSRGRWYVVLHRSNCPECESAIPQYEKFARRLADGEGRVALVEVPPYSSPRVPARGNCVESRLSSDREWFVHTPFEIQVQDGVVVSASADLPALVARSGGAPVPPADE
jgi:hypothetical protein